jgi:hypothetical protein
MKTLDLIYWWVAVYVILALFVLGRKLEFPELW